MRECGCNDDDKCSVECGGGEVSIVLVWFAGSVRERYEVYSLGTYRWRRQSGEYQKERKNGSRTMDLEWLIDQGLRIGLVTIDRVREEEEDGGCWES